jgi:Domain of unknown function (DUF4105)
VIRAAVRAALLVAWIALSAASTSAIDSPPPASAAYLDELIAQADALQLAGDPQWLALVHYEPRHFSSGFVSSADSSWFFQARDGKTDPRAELHATLRRFFESGPQGSMKDGEPPQCALRGRYTWLERRLHFDAQRLPPQPCERFASWRSGLQPWGVSLIFPEAYMNNPSSMFGHTLLRIDSGPPGERSDLLAYGVNFSADTGDDGGIAFAWKGMLGFYPGRFGVEPYYDIITRYGDWERRDIWEYRLALDPAAVELLLAHLWELRGVEFDYYFFDENCSYQILTLIDVARPDLRLHEQFHAWVVPADTVRAVVGEPGLVAATAFRPSAGTQLRAAARQLTRAQRTLASGIADGRIATDSARLDGLSAGERAAVLGTAYELFRCRYLVGREASEAERSRARRILLARSELPVEGSSLPPVPTPALRPDEGHGTTRLLLGTGVRDNRFYLETGFRFGYHDLLDPSGGYTAGAQIDFADLVLRYYTKDRQARVHRFTLADILSLAPVDAFFHPISWQVGTGLFSRLIPQGRSNQLEEAYVWRSHGGAGLAAEPWVGALAYAFVDATADYSPTLEEDHAIGPGARVGVYVAPPSDRWRAHVVATATRFALGDVSTAASIAFEGRLTLSRNVALKLEVSGNRDFDQNWLEAGVTLNVYF